MRSKKHLKTNILVLITLCFLISSCNSSNQATTPDTSPTAPPTIAASATPDISFEGIAIKVLTFDGPQITEPLVRRAPDFEALTGADVEIISVGFSDLDDTILNDLSTQSNAYQAYVFAPQWLTDYAALGHFADLTSHVTNDAALQWDDITPFFRDFSATYQGKIYTIPLDGDFQMVYYRSDLIEAANLMPPETWADYLALAAALHGQDMNEDGQPDYGSCIAKTPGAQSYWMFWSIASAFLQSQGTHQGAFFDPETMEPLVNNDAFAAALEIYKATSQYGPPDELELDVGDTRDLFVSGRCALSIDWGDIGTLSIAPDSKIMGKLGAVMLPGTTSVFNPATGALSPCDRVLCPYAVNEVNHAPFAAFGGWSGGISAYASKAEQEVAYTFLSYMSQPAQANEDVTIGATGFNPYRFSQFKNHTLWVEAGMDRTTVERYLGAIGVSLSNPNMALDLRIPQNNRYQQDVLDVALNQFLLGEQTTAETMQQIYDGWVQITAELGLEAQLAAYRASLGINE